MALRLQQPGIQPLGQFDGLDSIVLTVKGGEVATLVGVAVGSSVDKAAKDADGSDGYVGAPPSHKRPVVTTALVEGARPLFLVDDGTTHYGTLYGQVVGGTAGQITAGAQLGPHTATGSGKLTLWDKPGLYAVTLDAVDTTASTGLVPTNTGLSVGDPLFATTAGLLTPNSAVSFDGATAIVGRFIEFTTDQSLVTTSLELVSALNSPSGSAAQKLVFTQAIFHFSPPLT